MSETGVVPLKTGSDRPAPIIPTSIEEVFRIAKAIAASGLAPKGMQTPEQLTVAIMHGAELGLPPMQAVQRIAVVNGRPTLWGDAIPALLYANGFKIAEHVDDKGTAHCTVTRPDGASVTRSFGDADAKRAGLLGKPGPWQQYPDRMKMMRARAFAARDGAADVLGGLYLKEEIDGGELHEVVTLRKSSAEGKRDGSVKRFNELRAAVRGCACVSDLSRLRRENAETWDTLPTAWVRELDEEVSLRMTQFEPDVVLRDLERRLQAEPHLAVPISQEFAPALMAMDKDNRDSAQDMIQAATQQPLAPE